MSSGLEETLLQGEVTLRYSILFAVIALVAAWESVQPRRPPSAPLRTRWLGNFGIWLLGLPLTWLVPLVGTSFAVVIAARGGGVLRALELPGWLAFVAAFLALDLARYVEHVAYHRSAMLWRLHRMHHADPDYDFTVGFRFHPFEALVSVLITLGVIWVLGPPPAAVLVHQLVLLGLGVFAHANGSLPRSCDRWLRKVLITPDLHRVHHSTRPQETNSNFGGVVPWWDRLFGTYVDQPRAGHDAMRIGLDEFRDPRHLRLRWMLVHPFLRAGAVTVRHGARR